MNGTIIKLGYRLRACADYVRTGSKMADIGTDHAYLPIYLLQTGRVTAAIACDINEGPLETAAANAARFQLSDVISLRLSDGLQALLPDEADDIVIAGMGGELILQIILSAPWLFDTQKNLVLQPMSKPEILREGLFQNGFTILDEKVVLEDQKIYVVLNVRFTGEKRQCCVLEKYMGKIDRNEQHAVFYTKAVLASLQKKAEGLHTQGKTGEADKIRQVIAEIKTKYIE